MKLTELNEASYDGPKAVTTESMIRYAVIADDGEFYSESGEGQVEEGLAGAKLWMTETGAKRLAREWGSAMRPRPKNKVVKVEIRTMMRLVD